MFFYLLEIITNYCCFGKKKKVSNQLKEQLRSDIRQLKQDIRQLTEHELEELRLLMQPLRTNSCC